MLQVLPCPITVPCPRGHMRMPLVAGTGARRGARAAEPALPSCSAQLAPSPTKPARLRPYTAAQAGAGEAATGAAVMAAAAAAGSGGPLAGSGAGGGRGARPHIRTREAIAPMDSAPPPSRLRPLPAGRAGGGTGLPTLTGFDDGQGGRANQVCMVPVAICMKWRPGI